MVFKRYDDAAASIAHVRPADRLVIGLRPAASSGGWEYYACDIDAIPAGFAQVAWGTACAAEVESYVFEGKVREGDRYAPIIRERFVIVMMNYDPPQTPHKIHSPEVLIVTGNASDQEILVAVADMLVTETNQKLQDGKRLFSEELAASAEGLAKLLKCGTLDDGSPGSIVESVDRFRTQLWQELSALSARRRG